MIASRLGALRISIRAQTIWGLRQPRQQRRFSEAEIGARAAEVAPACRAGADQIAAEGRAIEILDQDLLLRARPLDLPGANRLLDLLEQRSRSRLAPALNLHRHRPS